MIRATTKQCRECGEEKQADDFYFERAVCKKCKRMKADFYYRRAVSLRLTQQPIEDEERGYLPTQQEIAERCREIQAAWSRGIERARRGLSGSGYELPVVALR